jgi:hypothetical protein
MDLNSAKHSAVRFKFGVHSCCGILKFLKKVKITATQWSRYMSMSMLHVCPCPGCMSRTMRHVHVRAVCLCPRCMFISPCSISMNMHGHGHMNMDNTYMDNTNMDNTYMDNTYMDNTCMDMDMDMDIGHGHVHRAWTWTLGMDIDIGRKKTNR